MIDYLIIYKGKKKKIKATNPLSAYKKAFRKKPSWHWEKTSIGFVEVYQGKTLVTCVAH